MTDPPRFLPSGVDDYAYGFKLPRVRDSGEE
jgi:hypothetical protein